MQVIYACIRTALDLLFNLVIGSPKIILNALFLISCLHYSINFVGIVETPFLDSDFSITNGIVSSNIYDTLDHC